MIIAEMEQSGHSNEITSVDPQGTNDLESFYRGILIASGEDPFREGLKRTPTRAAHTWRFLTSGYQQNPAAVLESAIFQEVYTDPIMVKDIEFYSMCEHHLLPFFGKVHISYVPSGRIVGLSKLPRLGNSLARRLQVQERLTSQIADTLEEILRPKGLTVQIDAIHLCLMMRGVEKQHTVTTTQIARGIFQSDKVAREAFFSQL